MIPPSFESLSFHELALYLLRQSAMWWTNTVNPRQAKFDSGLKVLPLPAGNASCEIETQKATPVVTMTDVPYGKGLLSITVTSNAPPSVNGFKTPYVFQIRTLLNNGIAGPQFDSTAIGPIDLHQGIGVQNIPVVIPFSVSLFNSDKSPAHDVVVSWRFQPSPFDGFMQPKTSNMRYLQQFAASTPGTPETRPTTPSEYIWPLGSALNSSSNNGISQVSYGWRPTRIIIVKTDVTDDLIISVCAGIGSPMFNVKYPFPAGTLIFDQEIDGSGGGGIRITGITALGDTIACHELTIMWIKEYGG